MSLHNVVSLACAIFLNPDILLLDEPTNHLDLEAIIWLQDYLQDYDGTLVIVSHDRSFLDSISTEIIHFHRKQLKYYPGNYESFTVARDDIIKKKSRIQEQLDKKREDYKRTIMNLQKAARQNKRNEKMLGVAASRKKKLNRIGLEKTEDGKKWNCQTHGYRPGSINANGGGWKGRGRSAASVAEPPEPAVSFKFPAPLPLAVDDRTPILQARGVCFSYATPSSSPSPLAPAEKSKGGGKGAVATKKQKKPLSFENIDLSLSKRSRVTLLGRNGGGKSTILKLLVGELAPTKGEVIRIPNLNVGYYSQHVTDIINVEVSALAYMLEQYPKEKPLDMRTYLGKFGLKGDVALQPIKDISGGQKSRLALANILFSQPQVIIQ